MFTSTSSRRSAKRGLLAAAAMVSLAAASCGDSDKPEESQGPPKLSDVSHERDVHITVSGAKNVDFKQRTKVRFLSQQGFTAGQNVSVMSVTVPDYASVSEVTKLMPDIAVFGDYKGDGTYKVAAGVGTPAPRTGPLAEKRELDPKKPDNHVMLTFLEMGPTPTENKFGYALEPCTIVIADKGETGSATCSKLVSIEGEQIAFKMTWKK